MRRSEVTVQQSQTRLELFERIATYPEIYHGKPCVQGLRYPVDVILELLTAGVSHADILADYDDLEPDDILAALAYATRLGQVKRQGEP